MNPEDGYGYVAYTSSKTPFKSISNNRWNIEIFISTGDEKFIGVRMIDDKLCNVWYSDKLEGYLAQGK